MCYTGASHHCIHNTGSDSPSYSNTATDELIAKHVLAQRLGFTSNDGRLACNVHVFNGFGERKGTDMSVLVHKSQHGIFASS